MNSIYLRIDTIEQALRDLCNCKVEGEGYRLAYRMAADNLGCGRSVVSDSCNPIELTRTEWREVAQKSGARTIDIEVICSDKAEHQKRVETRTSSITGLRLPTWEQVQHREYHPWKSDRIVLDTAGRSPEASFQQLISLIKKWE